MTDFVDHAKEDFAWEIAGKFRAFIPNVPARLIYDQLLGKKDLLMGVKDIATSVKNGEPKISEYCSALGGLAVTVGVGITLASGGTASGVGVPLTTAGELLGYGGMGFKYFRDGLDWLEKNYPDDFKKWGLDAIPKFVAKNSEDRNLVEQAAKKPEGQSLMAEGKNPAHQSFEHSAGKSTERPVAWLDLINAPIDQSLAAIAQHAQNTQNTQQNTEYRTNQSALLAQQTSTTTAASANEPEKNSLMAHAEHLHVQACAAVEKRYTEDKCGLEHGAKNVSMAITAEALAKGMDRIDQVLLINSAKPQDRHFLAIQGREIESGFRINVLEAQQKPVAESLAQIHETVQAQSQSQSQSLNHTQNLNPSESSAKLAQNNTAQTNEESKDPAPERKGRSV